MNIGEQLLLFVAVGAVAWFVWARTGFGRAMKRRMQAHAMAAQEGEGEGRGTDVNEDYEFLLQRCKGDEAEVQRRLEVEARKNPNLEEEQLYRRAIRAWFQEKRGGTHGSIAEELDDTWL